MCVGIGKNSNRAPILRNPLMILRSRTRNPAQVAVFVQVGELDAFANGVRSGAQDEGFVVLSVALGDGCDAGDDGFGEAFCAQAVEGPAFAVFDDVVEHGDHTFFGSRQAQHHAQWMQYIGCAGFVDLACVGFGCKDDGVFESRHGALIRPRGPCAHAVQP